MPVGVGADQRLQYRCADLVGQGDRADLGEAQAELAFQQGIDRNDQRLNEIVEKVREADCPQQVEARRLRRGGHEVRHRRGGRRARRAQREQRTRARLGRAGEGTGVPRRAVELLCMGARSWMAREAVRHGRWCRLENRDILQQLQL